MEPYIEVIDNFFKNPNEIRSIALEEKYERFNNGFYGGRDTLNRMIVIDEMKEKIKNILNKEHEIITGRFRSVTEKEYGRSYIHEDSNVFNKPGLHILICLTPDNLIKKNDAIVFYKHKELGISAKNLDNYTLEKSLKETLVIDKFIEYKSIEYKYNRCIILDYGIFHSPRYMNGYGDSLENSRLLYIIEALQ